MRTALTGRTHGCTDQALRREDSPCQLGAVHTWAHSGPFAIIHLGQLRGEEQTYSQRRLRRSFPTAALQIRQLLGPQLPELMWAKSGQIGAELEWLLSRWGLKIICRRRARRRISI